MRATPAVTALAAAAALTPAIARTPVAALASTAVARKSSQRPSAAQIRRAVRRAERSRNLWATVNICNTKRNPDVIGIRGQMPALGFKTVLIMDVQIWYLNRKTKKFVPDPAIREHVVLGAATTALHQDGASFRIVPPADLKGQITFSWALGGKVIGRTTRMTAGGIKGVDFADPHGYSAATCSI